MLISQSASGTTLLPSVNIDNNATLKSGIGPRRSSCADMASTGSDEVAVQPCGRI